MNKDINNLPKWKQIRIQKHQNKINDLKRRHRHWIQVRKDLGSRIKTDEHPDKATVLKTMVEHPTFTASQAEYYVGHSMRHKLSSRLYVMTHKKQQRIYNYRSYARKFISDMAGNAQLDDVQSWINDRKNILKGDN